MSVAKPLPHESAILHVTGAARYVDDLPAPAGALHLAFGLSGIARGAVAELDLSGVRAAPGVAATMVAADLPFANDVSPSICDEPLLSDGTVHYLGQPIFLVAAESHRAARRAARLAQVSYREETPILTIDDALAADSRFEDGPRIWSRGDAAQAIETAAHVVSGTLEIGGQEHFYLEGQAAMAEPQEGDGMLVRSSTQHPSEVQHKVADALGVPLGSVRVETRRMGGGFGGKESQANALAVACAVVARATGRTCKMRYDRDDDIIVTGKRHDIRITYRAGFSPEGDILGVEFRHDLRCGWSQDLSLPVADRAMLHADNAYRIPAIRIESHRLKTNTQSATAFRGFGGPQGMLGIEQVMEHAARRLGVDPVAIRMRNYYDERETVDADGPGAPGDGPIATEGDLHAPSPDGGGSGDRDAPSRPARGKANAAPASSGNVTPYGMKVEDFELGAITERLLETSDYARRRKAVDSWNARNDDLKRGLAFSPVKFGISFTLTHLNQAGALVHVYRDGSIHVNHGGTEMGQGLFRKVAQVVADRFGVDPARVAVAATDTAKVPNTSATAASSGSDLNGMAARIACDEIRGRMAERLALDHQADPASVRFESDRVHVGGESYGFGEAAQMCYLARVGLSATGHYATPKLQWDRLRGEGRPFLYFGQGAAVTEAILDTRTGENRLLRADLLHDVGTTLNPVIDIGQIEGGYVQGAGWLTTEELVWDQHGRLTTHAPSTYKIPTSSDRPSAFNVALWDGRNRENTIYRSKAVGEPPLMLAISAWLALADAVAACSPGSARAARDVPPLGAPATPEALWRAARDMRKLA